MNVLNIVNDFVNTKEFLLYLISLVLSTLLIGYAPSSIAFVLFVFCSLRYAYINKLKFQFDYALALPVLMYLFFVLSFFWTVDKEQTLKGLERTVSLALIPLVFMILPKIGLKEHKIILNSFTISNFFLGVFFLIVAIFNFANTKSISVFTYHELVDVFELNAIYVSLVFSVSLFYLISLNHRTILQNAMIVFFIVFIFLLSSKTILLVVCIGFVVYLIYFKISKISKNKIALLTFLTITIISVSSITLWERFLFEKKSSPNEVFEKVKFGKVYPWTGTSIRLMQLRILKEQIKDESIFFKGFGLFASKNNLVKRHEEFDTYFKFHDYNYHNQYAQMLSEMGIFGLILLMIILINIWRKALKTKNFLFLMFAVMITFVFFTESVLWRQRGLFLFIIFYALIISFSNKTQTLAS
mgnify:CR=1 FL=1